MGTNTSDSVTRMFHAIDHCQWERLPIFFHPDVVYDRPGHRQVQGIDDLMKFYREERRIESGRHELESVVVEGDHAVAIGTFRGQLRDGSPADEMFADAYTFRDGRIWRRRTY